MSLARLGPYEIVGKLGGGGMAVVFLGRKPNPAPGTGYGEVAAIKVIRPDLAAEPQFIEMFADEAKILSRLVHPNISRTLEVGHADHMAYIAMELLLGRTLADTWDAARAADVPFRFDLAAWICAEIARGLHYAHLFVDEAGHPLHLIHRDVNPSNIFLGYQGSIKLFDFGLAMAHGRRTHTRAGVVKGKVPYLSPEQVSQIPLDHRSDVFSLGVTLWEISTMSRLFKRDTDLATVLAIRDGVVPDPRALVEDYPETLYAIVRRALAVNRDERYATALELAEDLQAFVESYGLREMGSFVGLLLDRLFPGEREKQTGWVAEAATSRKPANSETMFPPAPIPTSPELDVEPSAVSIAMPLVQLKS